MRPTKSTCAGVVVLAVAASAGSPRADGEVVPPRCQPYVAVAERTIDEDVVWSQGLSLASCVQDATVIRVENREDVAPMVAQLVAESAPSMLVYLAAIERGNGPIQLRAAYHLGLGYVALITRARSGIVAPPDVATNPEAARRDAELHDELEPLLEGPRRAALIAFTAIDLAVTDDPSIVTDEIEREMVRHAREMLPALREPETESSEDIQVARAATALDQFAAARISELRSSAGVAARAAGADPGAPRVFGVR